MRGSLETWQSWDYTVSEYTAVKIKDGAGKNTAMSNFFEYDQNSQYVSAFVAAYAFRDPWVPTLDAHLILTW